MVWGILRFWPLLLPIAISIFVFVADEPIWKKFGLILLSIGIIVAGFITINIQLKMLCDFASIILLIILLIFYRNRGVI